MIFLQCITCLQRGRWQKLKRNKMQQGKSFSVQQTNSRRKTDSANLWDGHAATCPKVQSTFGSYRKAQQIGHHQVLAKCHEREYLKPIEEKLDHCPVHLHVHQLVKIEHALLHSSTATESLSRITQRRFIS